MLVRSTKTFLKANLAVKSQSWQDTSPPRPIAGPTGALYPGGKASEIGVVNLDAGGVDDPECVWSSSSVVTPVLIHPSCQGRCVHGPPQRNRQVSDPDICGLGERGIDIVSPPVAVVNTRICLPIARVLR